MTTKNLAFFLGYYTQQQQYRHFIANVMRIHIIREPEHIFICIIVLACVTQSFVLIIVYILIPI